MGVRECSKLKYFVDLKSVICEVYSTAVKAARLRIHIRF